jgi:hypothetical protein
MSKPRGLVRPEGLGKFKISPHWVSNPRHSETPKSSNVKGTNCKFEASSRNAVGCEGQSEFSGYQWMRWRIVSCFLVRFVLHRKKCGVYSYTLGIYPSVLGYFRERGLLPRESRMWFPWCWLRLAGSSVLAGLSSVPIEGLDMIRLLCEIKITTPDRGSRAYRIWTIVSRKFRLVCISHLLALLCVCRQSPSNGSL